MTNGDPESQSTPPKRPRRRRSSRRAARPVAPAELALDKAGTGEIAEPPSPPQPEPKSEPEREQEPAPEPEPEPKPEPGPTVRRKPVWPWIVALLVLVAAIGGTIGASIGLRQGGPLANQGPAGTRPTIVVATAVPIASVAASPAPSPGAPTAIVAAPQPPQPTRSYVVQPGDTLRSIAQDQYGDATQWPRIYEANRDIIGADPDALVAGTELRLPPPQ